MSHLFPTFVQKVWGHEEVIVNNEHYCGKLLRVNQGYASSEHRHLRKRETFYVLTGSGELRVNGIVHPLRQGTTFEIEPGEWHRFATLFEDLVLLEVSTFHSDDDVERLSESRKVSA